MKKLYAVALALAVAATGVNADCYMQNPKGSNDRANEASANRNNGNRLFDSQNNNRGGYNTPDKGTNKAANDAANLYYKSANRKEAHPESIYDENSNRNEAIQYPMMYYEGSQLQMEWTVQHGCGGNEANDPNKLNCNMVIQYMCDQDVNKPDGNVDHALTVSLADGLNTNTPDTAGSAGGNNCDTAAATTAQDINNRMNANDANAVGRHESEGWYCEGQMRARNAQLFAADQALNGNTAITTRQNPNGGRRGLEVAEERDYYPYGVPTPWRDLAYLTDDVSRCTLVETESQNTKAKSKCITNGANYNRAQYNKITAATCAAAGGTWATYQPYALPKPDCKQAPYSRVNHLGNARGDGVSPETAGYNATIPMLAQLAAGPVPVRTYPQAAQGGATANEYAKCIVRLRYNVSTDDYDPWAINSNSNGGNSPVKQNPNVDVGASAKLQLAINTNQFGRTFQDRSHVFFIKKRPAPLAGATILNLNVRGKRGNIVQTFPATEYDFVPQNADVQTGTYIHLQWGGSNTHNNGNPGGDGQTGDAGEGTGGTDRQNLVMVKDFDDNFPPPYESYAATAKNIPSLYDNACARANTPMTSGGSAVDCALYGATSGFYRNQGEVSQRAMNPTLDNTPASTLGGGLFVKIGTAADATPGKTYKYMGTRNNSFTNRGMKGTLNIVQGPQTAPATGGR